MIPYVLIERKHPGTIEEWTMSHLGIENPTADIVLVETRTIDNFVVRLRKFFEPNPSQPIYIKSVRGIGYKFEI